MVPEFQSSFIPKEAAAQDIFKKKKTGALGVLAISLFVISLLAAGGLYFYKSMLRGDIEALQAELAQAENAIDTETINEMAQFSQKLRVAQSLVEKHQVISAFLTTLASSTVSTVRFDSMKYNIDKSGNLEVRLSGQADSYASIALQENTFSQDKSFKSLSFSDLALSNNNSVSFSIDLMVDSKLSVYSP